MKLTEKQKLDTTAQQKIRKLNRCPFCQRGETWKRKLFTIVRKWKILPGYKTHILKVKELIEWIYILLILVMVSIC